MFMSAHSEPLSCVFAASKLMTSWSTPYVSVPPRLTELQAALVRCADAGREPEAAEACRATSSATAETASRPPRSARRRPAVRRTCLMGPPEFSRSGKLAEREARETYWIRFHHVNTSSTDVLSPW